MKYFTLFSLVLAFGCGSNPDSSNNIENGFRQYFYKSGKYRLNDIKKINGVEHSTNGAKDYSVGFNATLEVLENIQRPQRGFSLEDLLKGNKYNIHNAVLTFSQTDNGWIPVDLDYDELDF